MDDSILGQLTPEIGLGVCSFVFGRAHVELMRGWKPLEGCRLSSRVDADNDICLQDAARKESYPLTYSRQLRWALASATKQFRIIDNIRVSLYNAESEGYEEPIYLHLAYDIDTLETT